MHPIEAGNIVLILLGVALIVSGIVIVYRTVRGMVRTVPKDLKEWGSHLINLVIAVVFVVAGALFIVNNLRGNPLKFKAQASSVLHAG